MSDLPASRQPRLDALGHVTGATRYAGDVAWPGMLHARLVTSPYARARIVDIDPSAALATPGVIAVLTASDLGISALDDLRMFEPLAAKETYFAGQPLALVVATSAAAAADGAEAVTLRLDPLDPIVSIDEALDPSRAPARPRQALGTGAASMSVHGDVADAGDADADRRWTSPNVRQRFLRRSGQVEEALRACDIVRTGRFRLQRIYQAALEPQVALAKPEPDGSLLVVTSTQGIHYTHNQLSKMLGLPPDRVRVVGAPLGGAFGSKTLVVEPLAAAAALRLGRPVRLEFTRSEDFLAGNPMGAMEIDCTIGVRDGRLSVLVATVVQEAGAYSEWAAAGLASVVIGGPYRWDAWRVEGVVVETNLAGVGPYRAPGGPAATFARESLIDEICTDSGLDELELRLASLARPGDAMLDGRPWPEIGIEACLRRLGEHEAWRRRASKRGGRGVGVAAGYWPGAKSAAGVICRLESDGCLSILTGVADMSGALSGLASLAADTFGIDRQRVRVVHLDSLAAPATPYSGGSTITYSVGPAVIEAARLARERVLAVAAHELEAAVDDLVVAGDRVEVRGSPNRNLGLGEIAILASDGGRYLPVEGYAVNLAPVIAPLSAAVLAEVEVDPETGVVAVERLVVAQDVGRAIDADLVRAQIHGGALQGLGWALSEEILVDDAGNVLSGSFLDYAIPTATSAPTIETEIVEVPAPHGPMGARGVGEGPVVPTPAAIANAVARAVGRRFFELPMTRERVWRSCSRQ